MRTILAAVFCTMLVAAVGCKSDSSKMKSDSSMMKSDSMAAMDVCPHCPGVQHGTADGRCEVCGQKITGAGNQK